MSELNEPKIILYGTSWCGSTSRSRNLMDKKGIKYKWIDIDKDQEGGKFVEKVNNGYRSVPTIVFPDGSILVEPSDTELINKLEI